MFLLLQKHAFRNIFRNRYRTLIILFTICICSLVIVLIGGFYAYLFAATEQEIIVNEGHIRFRSTAADGFIRDYKALKAFFMQYPGIFQVTARLSVNGIAGYEDKSALFHGEGCVFEEQKLIADYIYAPRSRRQAEPEQKQATGGTAGGAEVGTILAANLQVKPGSILNFLVSLEGFTTGFSLTVDKVITTVSEKLDRVYVRIPLKVVQEQLGVDTVDSVFVVLKDNRDCEAAKKFLVAGARERGWDLEAAVYNRSDSYLQSVRDIYMSNYYFILAVIVITVFFSIANIVAMSIMERTKELGTMRSFGMRKIHLTALFISEGAYMGILGSLCGIVLSLLVINTINSLGGIYIPPQPTEESGFKAFFSISVPSMGLAVSVSVLVSLLASLVATIRLNFLSIVRELHYI